MPAQKTRSTKREGGVRKWRGAPGGSRKYLFTAIGGSGSSQLVLVLRKRYAVGNKPDTVFRPLIPALRIGDWDEDQGRLRDRARGFSEVDGESIDKFLVRYVRYLRRSPRRTAVFNTCAELGLFSKHRIDDVVFLIRHPLHAYASWAKPERHGAIVDRLGGINSETAIRVFARRWNATIDEAFRLRAAGLLGGIVRFEHAKADARRLSNLSWIFDRWESWRRNFYYLCPEAESLLKSLTGSLTHELYGRRDYWTQG